MVIWRLEYNQARFVWLRGIWADTKESAKEGSSRLKKYLERIMHGEAKLDQQAKLEKRMGDEMNEDGADEQWHPEDPRTNVPKRRRSTGRSSESARQRRLV
ncbi:unnamed protein product [Anisakis simplex]|uniref:Reverse transcriptase n=2 Tax=Anisakis simplex TaxID=6269 RepID=A0A0M3KGW9_ANISI|nr:unnamed protein product [Anisakis simplex]